MSHNDNKAAGLGTRLEWQRRRITLRGLGHGGETGGHLFTQLSDALGHAAQLCLQLLRRGICSSAEGCQAEALARGKNAHHVLELPELVLDHLQFGQLITSASSPILLLGTTRGGAPGTGPHLCPELVDGRQHRVLAVHDGRRHIPVYVTENMVGHKLGEFSPTRTFRAHSGRVLKRSAALK